MRVDEPLDPFAGFPKTTSTRHPLPTSSFDALLRLSKLDDSIQDALALRDTLAANLDSVICTSHQASPEKFLVAEAEDYSQTISYACNAVQKQVRALHQRLAEKRKNLQQRRQLLVRERDNQVAMTESIETERVDMANKTEEKLILQKSVAAQRRRISTDLANIFPISPHPTRPLAFSIRGLHLPNSEDLDASRTTPESVAAALGHISHLLALLSYYWSVVLPYSLRPRCSSSSIIDSISNLSSTNPAGASSTSSPFAATSASGGVLSSANERAMRTFPLFSKGAVRFRFEYGLFLLNKDVQLLLETGWGVRILDIRQTMPNLALAVYCATAGEGQLPARKAGGVRGLLSGARDDERRDSADSATVVGSDGGKDADGGVVIGGGAAFESLKRVGKGRERRH